MQIDNTDTKINTDMNTNQIEKLQTKNILHTTNIHYCEIVRIIKKRNLLGHK